jgi:hypothetical protein
MGGCGPAVSYHGHKTPSLDLTESQLDPLRTIEFYILVILRSSLCRRPQIFLIQVLCAFLSVQCMLRAHPVAFIILIMCFEVCFPLPP